MPTVFRHRPFVRAAGLILMVIGVSVAPLSAVSAQPVLRAAGSVATSTSISVSPLTHGYGTPSTATISVRTATGRAAAGRIAVSLDQRLITVPYLAGNGQVRVSIPASTTIGRHVVSARYLPTPGNSSAPSTARKAFDVIRGSVGWQVSTGPATYGSRATLWVHLVSPASVRGGVFLAQGGVVVDHRAVDARGNVTLAYSAIARPTSLTLSFSGNSQLAPARTSVRVPVQRAATTVSVAVPALTAGRAATARVTVGGAGPASVSGSAILLVDGRAASSAILSRGRTAVTIPGLAAGTHRIQVRVTGDFVHLPATSAVHTAHSVGAVNPCPPSARACVDLTHNLTWLQSGGRITYGPVPMTSGRPGFRTPPGIFSVFWKDQYHFSSEYFAPMPNSVFFNGGVAFHEGSLSVASHGCVHLSAAASRSYFGQLRVGDRVSVFGVARY